MIIFVVKSDTKLKMQRYRKASTIKMAIVSAMPVGLLNDLWV